MTKRYPAGSEWRKWDLHVHIPGTKLNDNYDKKGGKPDWDRFAEIIKQSDVAVFGITDYFSVDQTLKFIKHFKSAYPNSEKLLIALDFDAVVIHDLSEPFRKNEKGTFLKSADESDQVVDIEKAQANPSGFMLDLFSKKQKLNQGNLPADIAKRVLTATPEIRFTAELAEDRIGGFERSTMTPGKQALFALTLILGEAEERWALLIDQPDDDLDSRSIYMDIVRYLVEQRKPSKSVGTSTRSKD